MKNIVVTSANLVSSRLCHSHIEFSNTWIISIANYSSKVRGSHHKGVQYVQALSEVIAEATRFVWTLFITSTSMCVPNRIMKTEDISTVLKANFNRTAAVIDFCRKIGCKLVYVSCSTKLRDGSLSSEQRFYARAKAANMELIRNFGNWFGLEQLICYYNNVCGGAGIDGKNYAIVMVLFKPHHHKGMPFGVAELGSQLQTFSHVEDIVNALVMVDERGVGDEFGTGSSEVYGTLQIAKMFGGEIVMRPSPAGNWMSADEVPSEMARALGWSPRRMLPNRTAQFAIETEKGFGINA